MFLVVPDLNHGLVAAPRGPEDVTPDTGEALTGRGFTWNSEIEAYTRPTGHSPEDVDRTAGVLRDLGHYVFDAHMPLFTENTHESFGTC
ncbi:hypothetical protein [Streptomyces anthocyanicus]|uniref:hypothetical protein n=1 Tax=Streptomyces anthocyanicus TaxID=68174 RepID=UPI00386C131C|nr:hypothetical protein OH747_39605 [Streptomyces anthocyanicus]